MIYILAAVMPARMAFMSSLMGDQRVTLANNNGYLGNTQIASGTLEVSDNSQLGTQVTTVQ